MKLTARDIRMLNLSSYVRVLRVVQGGLEIHGSGQGSFERTPGGHQGGERLQGRRREGHRSLDPRGRAEDETCSSGRVEGRHVESDVSFPVLSLKFHSDRFQQNVVPDKIVDPGRAGARKTSHR
ncbi:MAG TPA: hypothetical protein VN083_07500, partial [Vicinamibacteria bacterium]|nr:hypothetical protein [Vicinamibacteria bacterium]